ncbi:MAG: hypothetical protein CFH01_00076 [Alphaproteobacteria bacterium MarineAlpha2_Bin1]|nr:MAG: hypothetical protein CFH01_00076 [Alphaproteobacteria bacterium MarineAlpha2_Bin1]
MNYIKFLKLVINPITIIFIFLVFFLSIKILGFDSLIMIDLIRKNYLVIMSNVESNLGLVIILFIIIYIIVTTLSIPVATYLTLLGGLLFGQYKGTVIVLISATIGATLIFIIFRYASNYFSKKINNKYLENVKVGFNKNPMLYLLLLRLIPVFPFFVVNIVSAIMNVKLSQYIIATSIGMIPMTFFYCSIGSSAGLLMNRETLFNYKQLFDLNFLVPFVGIIILLFVSFIFKRKIGNVRHG